MANDMNKGSSKKDNVIRLLRQPLALIIWFYIIVKLFIFDIDIYFTKLILPETDLIKYKFVLIILASAVSLLIMGSKQFSITLLYILTYPLILIGWKLPKKLYGSTANVIFTFIGSVILTIKSGKAWFISTAFFIVASAAIFGDFGKTSTVIAMSFLFALLCKHLYGRFANAFRPENILSRINKFLKLEWATNREKTVLQDFRDSTKYPPDSDAFIKKRTETIANLILYNNLFKLIAYKLKDFHESRIIVVYSILRLVYTFIITVVIFALEYFSLQRIMPDSFVTKGSQTFFAYLYFSFNAIRGSNVIDVIPSSSAAKMLTSVETVFGMLILIILFFFFTTVMRQKYEEELKELIEALESESVHLRTMLMSEFSTPQEEIEQKYADFLITFKVKK